MLFLKNKNKLLTLILLPIFLFGNLCFNGSLNNNNNKISSTDYLSTTDSGAPIKIKQIESGTNFNGAIVTNDGVDQLYTWGQNSSGQLGIGEDDTENSRWDTPQKVDFLNLPSDKNPTIEQISFGTSHSAAVLNYDDSDHLYTWGENFEGQLGLGNKTPSNIPQEVTMLPNGDIEQISIGFESSAAVIDDGSGDELYTWGDNSKGQLGLGNDEDYDTLQKVTTLPEGNIEQIVMGRTYSAAIVDNELYSWGNNTSGQLGLGDDEATYNTPQKVEIPSTNNVQKIALSNYGYFSAAIVDNELYTWGNNTSGQLGLGDDEATYNTPQKVTFPGADDSTVVQDISLGEKHSAAIVDDELYTWGDNNFGQLGLGDDEATYNTPQKVTKPINGEISQISMGGSNSEMLITNSKDQQIIYGWGSNVDGQLGIENGDSSYISPTFVWGTYEISINEKKLTLNSSANKFEEAKINFEFSTDLVVSGVEFYLYSDDNGSNFEQEKTWTPSPASMSNTFSPTTLTPYIGEVEFTGLEKGRSYKYDVILNYEYPFNSYNDSDDHLSVNLATDYPLINTFDEVAPKFESTNVEDITDTSAKIDFTYSYGQEKREGNDDSRKPYDKLDTLIIEDDKNNYEETFSFDGTENKIILENITKSKTSAYIIVENLSPNTNYNFTLFGEFSNSSDNKATYETSILTNVSFETTNESGWYQNNWYYFVIGGLIILIILLLLLTFIIWKRKWIIPA